MRSLNYCIMYYTLIAVVLRINPLFLRCFQLFTFTYLWKNIYSFVANDLYNDGHISQDYEHICNWYFSNCIVVRYKIFKDYLCDMHKLQFLLQLFCYLNIFDYDIVVVYFNFIFIFVFKFNSLKLSFCLVDSYC